MKTNEQKIYYTLRIASAMCFIGHGAFGIITKEIWCNYFAVFGIGHATAYTLMPYLGTIDVLMGISLLFYPTKAILIWLVVWGTITAILRPLSGEPVAEFIERAGNFGAPLALLILSEKNIKGFFTKINPVSNADAATVSKAAMCLRVVVFLLFVGHGWLNLIDKKGLLSEYSLLGFSNPANVAQVIGIFEIAAACFVLIKPVRPVLIFLFVWKAASELFYPHWEIFEWIERSGSYGTILALWFVTEASVSSNKKFVLTGS
jgi:hypothetical protein